MSCDSSFLFACYLPAGQTLLLKICFLDSQQYTGAAGGKVQATLQVAGIGGAQRTVAGKFDSAALRKACLLYTSDAADD